MQPLPHFTAGQAAMAALLDSVEASPNPSWRHAVDAIDLMRAPIGDLHQLLATAPTAMARAFMAGCIVQRC